MSDQVKDRELESTEGRLTTEDLVREPEIRKQENEKAITISHLLKENEAGEFRSRWEKIQGSFVDEPRKAVQEADSLVADVMQHLARLFADERQNLESQWGRGGDVSTEDLRVALQRYRAFFSRLLTV